MSTQYRSGTTGEWVCTRYFGGSARGVCVDFGADMSRVFDIKEVCQRGETFINDDTDSTITGMDFWVEVIESTTWTFGEFGGTFEVGSGDIARFCGE